MIESPFHRSAILLAIAPMLCQIGLAQSVGRRLETLRTGGWPRRVEAHSSLAADGASVLPELTDSGVAASREGVPALQSLIGAIRLRIAITDPEAVSVMLGELGDERPNAAKYAAMGIALSPHAVVEDLVEVAASGTVRARLSALRALTLMGGDAEIALPVVRTIFQDSSAPSELVVKAAGFLGAFRDADPRTLDALLTATREGDDYVAREAAWALIRIGEPALSHLVRALDNDRVAAAVSVALAGFGEIALEAIGRELATMETVSGKAGGLFVLGHSGREDARLAEFVLGQLASPDSSIQDAALGALAAVADSASAIPHLRAGLESEVEGVRAGAARAARRMGPETIRALLGDLCFAWTDEEWQDESQQEAVIDALLTVADGSTDVAKVALEALMQHPHRLGAHAVLLLQAVGDEAAPLVLHELFLADLDQSFLLMASLSTLGDDAHAALLDEAEGPYPERRLQALAALGLAARVDDRVRAVFKAALGRRDSQLAALRALAWIGEDASSLLRPYSRAWNELDDERLVPAIRAFGKWDPDATGLVSKLVKIVEGERSLPVRVAAVAALGHGRKYHKKRRKTLLGLLAREGGRKAGFRSIRASPLVPAACIALTELGEPDEATIVAVAAWARSKDRLAALLALKAIESFGPEASIAAMTIGKNLDSSDPMVQFASLRALAAMGADIGEVTTRLGDLATWGDPELVGLALDALEAAGPAARPALPYLGVVLLRDDRPRYSAPGWVPSKASDGDLSTWTYEPTDPGARAVEVRSRAAALLARLANAAPEDAHIVRSLLERGTRVKDLEVARAAREALGQLPE